MRRAAHLKIEARVFAALLLLSVALGRAEPIPDFYSIETARFSKLLRSASSNDRLEAIKGFSALKNRSAEERLLSLLEDDSLDLRLEAVVALARIGSTQAIPRLIAKLSDPSWEIRAQAHLGLCRIAGQSLREDAQEWSRWWNAVSAAELVRSHLELIGRSNEPSPEREKRFVSLRHLALPRDESACLELLSHSRARQLSAYERGLLCETLESVGTTNSIPTIARLKSDAAAWALGAIGGPEAEAALLHFRKTLPVLLNLDRLHSTNAGSFLPHLIQSFGLVTYRAHPDDLNLGEPQPIQRVAANLIARSGLAAVLIEATLRELEATMAPPIARDPPLAVPEPLAAVLKAMRAELKPGFVRGDGETTSQPIVAMCHLACDPALAPRLRVLLRHPAIVPRIYVAMLLGKLKSQEAVPDLIQIVGEGYSFSDATALASGKHFDQSQTVRWRGYLCMALGKIGSENARAALERFASDPNQPRDVRYGAVVGLGFTSNPASQPVLARIAREDLIWMVQDEARGVLQRLSETHREALAAAEQNK